MAYVLVHDKFLNTFIKPFSFSCNIIQYVPSKKLKYTLNYSLITVAESTQDLHPVIVLSPERFHTQHTTSHHGVCKFCFVFYQTAKQVVGCDHWKSDYLPLYHPSTKFIVLANPWVANFRWVQICFFFLQGPCSFKIGDQFFNILAIIWGRVWHF